MRKLILGLLLLVAGFSAYVVAGLPWPGTVSALARKNPGVTSVMRQREREAEAAGRRHRRVQHWVPLRRVSRHLVHAVIASEDQKFFGHEGVDWEAIKKSLDENREKGRIVRGGSTITQQLAKNLFFTTRKNPVRKLRELMMAPWLESQLTKARILELYLNVIEWGDGVYGAEAAARRYYGTSAAALGPEQAAGLAAMIPNPRRINPRVSPARHARAQRRVLWLMSQAGYLGRTGLGAQPPPPEPEEEPEDDEEPPPEEELADEQEPLPEDAEAPEGEPEPSPTPEPEAIASPSPMPTGAPPVPEEPEPSPSGIR